MGDLVSVWCDPMGADRFASGRFEGLVVDSRFEEASSPPCTSYKVDYTASKYTEWLKSSSSRLCLAPAAAVAERVAALERATVALAVAEAAAAYKRAAAACKRAAAASSE